jgi:uncharacterized membrane protein YdjX (TVP38/TMEM64 family)
MSCDRMMSCRFVYAFLELIIIPAVPLTMAAGVLFGVGPGLAVVSFASTAAAAVAFLITRYAARDKVQYETHKWRWVVRNARSACNRTYRVVSRAV